ncbi:hypothetical protein [Cytobacillus sp. IB215665]|uniref:hypothetical protein n=1 Tax=Cytobacillus sp. IB215665 TaxID=3097357 RepID=UPI002A16B001|nr:hypothetical protein [Cytobacillus sp. IB215665]MDX8367895.1 hypothetical protein [Cytobacillus sp. IB215665]
MSLEGHRFGRWVLIERVNHPKYKMWHCKCDCGNEKDVNENNLKRGKSISCGCHRKEKLHKLKSVHNCEPRKLYNVWLAMRRRCYLETTRGYEHYGGRGIEVSEVWRHDFEAFRDWSLSNGYKEGLSIDRIDNDGNYSPENCRWVDRKTQNNNKRNVRKIEIKGATKTLAEWAQISGIKHNTLTSRLAYGWTNEELLTETEGKGTNGTTTKRKIKSKPASKVG